MHQPPSDDSGEDSLVDSPDLFRDTPVRYLGYANEVGEAFRPLVHVDLVRFSYLVASGYAAADAIHKGYKANQKSWESDAERKKNSLTAVVDTLIWQGLASVAIPGFVINRICFLSNYLLTKISLLPANIRLRATTTIGLACIPFIIKPIDRSVDFFMNHSLRQWGLATLEKDVKDECNDQLD